MTQGNACHLLPAARTATDRQHVVMHHAGTTLTRRTRCVARTVIDAAHPTRTGEVTGIGGNGITTAAGSPCRKTCHNAVLRDIGKGNGND